MSRYFLVPVCLVFCLGSSHSLAQDISSLFKDRSHDFGVVARASKADHVFEFVNNTGKEIHLQSVRTSCNCTTPKILTSVVKPGETGKINAQFNTTSFLGDRSATITLSVSKPYWTQVQLQIKGYVRKDIVVQPGKVDFGVVNSGTDNAKTIKIKYAGSSNWRIDKVTSENPNLSTEIKQVKNQSGRIDYELSVKLNGEQDTGYLNESLVLHTNDRYRKQFPILVSGRVQAAIEVPSVVFIGDVEKGQSVKKSVILKSDREFKVTDIQIADKRVEIPQPSSSKKLHMLVLLFDASDVGAIDDEIVVQTDHPASAVAKFKIQGMVK